MLVALLALALSAAAVGPAGFWPLLSVVVLAALGVGALAFGLLRPARHLRGDRAAARLVARLHPAVASDLVSAVELGPPDEMPADDRRRDGGGLAHAGAGAAGLGRQRGRAARSAPPDLAAARRCWRWACSCWSRRHRRGAAAVARSDPRPARRWRTGRRASRARRSRRRRWSATCASPTSTRRTPACPRASSTARRATSSRSRGPRCGSKRARCGARARRCCCWAKTASAASCPRSWSQGVMSTELTLIESGTYRFWLRADPGPAGARAAQPPHDRRGRQPAARRDPRPRRSAGAADAAADRDRLHRRRRLRSRPRRAGLPRRRSAGAAPAAARRARRARGAGARWSGIRRRRARCWRASASPIASKPRIATRSRARRSDRRARSTSSSRTRTRASRSGSIASASCSTDWSRTWRTGWSRHRAAPDAARPRRGDAPARLATIGILHEAEESHLALLGRLLDDDRREGTLGKALRATLAGIADRLEQRAARRGGGAGPQATRRPQSRQGDRRQRAGDAGQGRRARRRSTPPSWRRTCCCSTI